MNFFGMTVLLIIYLAILRNAYFAWFHPKKYFAIVSEDRMNIAKIAPFVINLWTVKPIINNPRIDLFWARFASLLMVIISTLVVVTVIFR